MYFYHFGDLAACSSPPLRFPAFTNSKKLKFQFGAGKYQKDSNEIPVRVETGFGNLLSSLQPTEILQNTVFWGREWKISRAPNVAAGNNFLKIG